MRVSGVLNNMAKHISITCSHNSICVVVRFCCRVKFYFPLFKNYYYTLAFPETEELNSSRKETSAWGGEGGGGVGGKITSSKGTLQTDFLLVILWEIKVRLVHHKATLNEKNQNSVMCVWFIMC